MDKHLHGERLRKLKFKWLLLTGAAAFFLLAGLLLLRPYMPAIRRLIWAGLAASAMSYFLWVVYQGLERNRRPGTAELLSVLGPGTILTVTRGILVSLLLGFLALPGMDERLVWLPAALYWLAMLTDFLDGYVARITDYVTELGSELDLKLDGLGVLAATLVAFRMGQVPAAYLTVGLARYLFVFGIWIRRRNGMPVHPLPPSVRRRAFAGVQMGFIGVMLMPVFAPPGTHLAALIFMAGFLAGFVVDWFYICGWLHPGDLKFEGRWRTFLRGAALFLRLFSAAALAALALPHLAGGEAISGVKALASAPLRGAGWIYAGLSLALTLGTAGRIVSLASLIWLGFSQVLQPLSAAQLALVISASGVFFLGTGPASLWRPENRLIFRRAGEAV